MLLYQDILTGDEMFSDAFPFKEINDVVIEVDCKMIAKKEGVDVNIGANPSAEEQEEALEEGSTMVNNVADTFRLQTTNFDKGSYKTYLKSYMKAVSVELKKTDAERAAVFEKKAIEYVKKVLANFKDYEFFTGESMDPDGMVALLNYREDGVTPYLTFWKDGLKVVKL